MMWSSASAIPGKCASTNGAAAAGGTRLMLAGGQILPVLRKLAPSNHDVRAIWTLLRATVHPVDLLVLTMLGWGTVPLFGVIYYYCFRRRPRNRFHLKRMGLSTASSFSKEEQQQQQQGVAEEDCCNDDEDDDGVLLSSIFTSDDFLSSYMFHVADHVSQASRLAILVYLVDCLAVLLSGLGFSSPALHHPNTNLSTCFAKILYIAWAAQRMSVFKRYLLGRVIHKQQRLRMQQQQQQQQNGMGTNGSTHTMIHGTSNGSTNGLKKPGVGALRRSSTTGDLKTLGQAAIIDRLVDGLIWVVTGLFLLDILNVEMGVGVSSIFAFGSAGTLVMGLASKDVASMFVSGLTLTTTDHVREGDHVKFGDGTSGQILRIGWMHTTIRGYDELVEVVRSVTVQSVTYIVCWTSTERSNLNSPKPLTTRSWFLPFVARLTDPQFDARDAAGQEHIAGLHVPSQGKRAAPVRGRRPRFRLLCRDSARDPGGMSERHYRRNEALPGRFARLRKGPPGGDGRRALCRDQAHRDRLLEQPAGGATGRPPGRRQEPVPVRHDAVARAALIRMESPLSLVLASWIRSVAMQFRFLHFIKVPFGSLD